MQRREDLKSEKRRKEEEAAKAKDRRRERRMCLKEQKRISELQDTLMATIVPASEQKEYVVSLPIYDLRDYVPGTPPGIFTFGGFIGEFITALHCLNEYMNARVEYSGFEMKSE